MYNKTKIKIEYFFAKSKVMGNLRFNQLFLRVIVERMIGAEQQVSH